MGRVVKGPSTCAGIALCALGCTGRPPGDSKTVIVVVVADAGAGGANPIGMPDAAVNSPDVNSDAADSALVNPDAPDADCNQAGATACDNAIGAICQRYSQ